MKSTSCLIHLATIYWIEAVLFASSCERFYCLVVAILCLTNVHQFIKEQLANKARRLSDIQKENSLYRDVSINAMS